MGEQSDGGATRLRPSTSAPTTCPSRHDSNNNAGCLSHHHNNDSNLLTVPQQTAQQERQRRFSNTAKLYRRLEQALNVHPERYRPTSSAQRSPNSSFRPPPSPNGIQSVAGSISRQNTTQLPNATGAGAADDGQSMADTRSHSLDYFGRTPLLEMGLSSAADAVGASVSTAHPASGQLGPSPASSPLVVLNVGGRRFVTFEETLARFPNTLLGNPSTRAHFWCPQRQEYFLDRHAACFEWILYVYQSNGTVRRPELIPLDIFLAEFHFFQMGAELLEALWISEGYEKPAEVPMPTNKTQRRLWELMEYPDSSLAARVVAFISISVIIISIVSFCLETIPGNHSSPTAALLSNGSLTGTEAEEEDSSPSAFFWLECVCIVWFTIELSIRFMSCPSKTTFLSSFLNIIDFVAIAPFFVNLIWQDASKGQGSMSFAVLRVLRLVRVFRIFKLSRHSVGLQILGKTFRASVQEFCLLIFFMTIALVLFSSGIYFAEQGEPNTKFTSIPASFWFVLVTMTTVGYGDLVPTGTYGKIVGSLCALIGVLTLALPVPIIVANFKHFYRQENRLQSMKLSKEMDDDCDGGYGMHG